MPPSLDTLSAGEHHSASQDAAVRLGPLRPPVSLHNRRGCELHLPQAADGTDTSRTRVRSLSISASLCLAPSLFPALGSPGSLFLSSFERSYCTGSLRVLGATQGCCLTLPWPHVRGRGQPHSGTKAETGAQDRVCFCTSSDNWSRRPCELQNPARDR